MLGEYNEKKQAFIIHCDLCDFILGYVKAPINESITDLYDGIFCAEHNTQIDDDDDDETDLDS